MPNHPFKNTFNLAMDAEGFCLHPQTGRRICGRKNRRGRFCARSPAVGAKACKFHGGATPAGIASVHFKTGRYSRMLPERMYANYQELKADPDLTSLASEIALVRAHIFDLIRQIDTGEAGQVWATLTDTWSRLESARETSDAAAMALALNDLGRIINQGSAQVALWRDIGYEIDRVNRLVTQESKQRQLAEAMITIERALVWAGAVGAIVREYIHDPDILSAISSRIRGTLVVAPGGRIGDGR